MKKISTLLVTALVLLSFSGCASSTWDTVKESSSDAWEATKDASKSAYKSAKDAVK